MPFTLAHPAAILPLRGVPGLRTVPLIIGAMMPDLPYYVPLPGELIRPALATHTFLGSFTTCLAFGYLALLCGYFLRLPLTALLSPRARWLSLTALGPFSRPREWLLAPLAIVLGVWTHLLWDSFTHPDGWAVQRMAALSAPVTLGSYSVPLYHVLQYASSVFGLAVIAVWYWRLPVPQPASPAADAVRSPAGPLLLLVAAAALLIGAVKALERLAHNHSLYSTVDVLLTRSLSWFAGLYLIAGALATLEHARERESGLR